MLSSSSSSSSTATIMSQTTSHSLARKIFEGLKLSDWYGANILYAIFRTSSVKQGHIHYLNLLITLLQSGIPATDLYQELRLDRDPYNIIGTTIIEDCLLENGDDNIKQSYLALLRMLLQKGVSPAQMIHLAYHNHGILFRDFIAEIILNYLNTEWQPHAIANSSLHSCYREIVINNIIKIKDLNRRKQALERALNSEHLLGKYLLQRSWFDFSNPQARLQQELVRAQALLKNTAPNHPTSESNTPKSNEEAARTPTIDALATVAFRAFETLDSMDRNFFCFLSLLILSSPIPLDCTIDIDLLIIFKSIIPADKLCTLLQPINGKHHSALWGITLFSDNRPAAQLFYMDLLLYLLNSHAFSENDIYNLLITPNGHQNNSIKNIYTYFHNQQIEEKYFLLVIRLSKNLTSQQCDHLLKRRISGLIYERLSDPQATRTDLAQIRAWFEHKDEHHVNRSLHDLCAYIVSMRDSQIRKQAIQNALRADHFLGELLKNSPAHVNLLRQSLTEIANSEQQSLKRIQQTPINEEGVETDILYGASPS